MSAEGKSAELARDLAAEARGLAADAERQRRLPADFSRELARAGFYRLCVPASVGGGEAEPAELLRVVEDLAAGDAAAGWCVAVCATAGMLGAYLEPDAAAEVYADPMGVVGGVFAPSGRASVDGDELVVSGRWRFCSNVDNCHWVMGGCVVFDGDTPRTLDTGRPDIRLVLMPVDAVEVLDTWSVSGLRATGSHDIAVESLAVPATRAASLITDRPREPGALYAFPPFGLLAAAIAAVALGTARGALDEFRELAGAKTPTLSTRKLAERAATQSGLARAEATVRAARALLLDATAECWQTARGGGEIGVDQRAGLRLASTHAVEASAAAIDEVYRLGGGSAIYETSPLQRRFRDIHAATQHMLVGPATWELAGRSLLALDFDASQL